MRMPSGALDLCQNVFNLAQLEQGRELIPWCHAHGVNFVAYSPLGAGFLTGKYGSRGELSPKGTRFDVIPGHRDVYFRPECFDALDRLNLVAEESYPHHQLALGWVLQRTDIAVILVELLAPSILKMQWRSRIRPFTQAFWRDFNSRVLRSPADRTLLHPYGRPALC